jgi:porin
MAIPTGVGAALMALALALPAPSLAFDSDDTSNQASPNSPESAGVKSETTQGPAAAGSVSARSSDPAKSAEFSKLNFKAWSFLSPDFGDMLLGDAGGVRSGLADHGIGLGLSFGTVVWQNLLNGPSRTNGQQTYIGQLFTVVQSEGVFLSYDLGRVGLHGSQISTDTGCAQASYLVAGTNKCRIRDLSYYQPFLHGRIELTAGLLNNTVEYADTYLGGNLAAGAFGPTSNLMVQSGLSNNTTTAPGLNVKYHFDANWYDRLGVQRSTSPQGLLADQETINPYGVRFAERGARELVINEFGFRQEATADAMFSYFRMGALYNWSGYMNFETGKNTRNYNSYLLGDQQLSRPDSDLPYRGWYGGFTVMDSPSDVNVFRRYYETRLFDIGPFRSRPADQFNIVATRSVFSDEARQSLLANGGESPQAFFSFPPRKESMSLTSSYAFKAGPGTYLVPALAYTNHPTFAAVRGQGSDLNISLSFTSYL